MANEENIRLEPAAQQFAEENETPPFLYELPVEEGRQTVNEAQQQDAAYESALVKKIEAIPTPTGTVSVTKYTPVEPFNTLPAIVYAHGGGWVFGNDHTHDRLMKELATLGKQVVYFVNYSLSPEAKYPTALEEIYAVTQWVTEHAEQEHIDPQRITIAGDSAGGNMATATAILAKQRQGPFIAKQLLFYPVTDAAFETASYHAFARGYFLHRDGMKWFWDQYTASKEQRALITVSPLRATIDELTELPPALIITGEADVLRDEGEAYAEKLEAANVATTLHRMPHIIHDFMMLNALAETEAKKKALQISIDWLNQ